MSKKTLITGCSGLREDGVSAPLLVIEPQPVQYHAPVYRMLQQKFGVPVTAIYGTDRSLAGYHDAEFGVQFSWDTDLLSGYTARFLSRVRELGRQRLGAVLREERPGVLLLVGYGPGLYREALLWALRLGRPILFRGETTDHALRRGPVKRWVRDRLLRQFYGRCAKILYVGQRSLLHFKRLGCPESQLIFSPYCVDTVPFQDNESHRASLRASLRGRLGIPEDDRVILFSGKLCPRKGVSLLVGAAKSLPVSVREKTTLLFVGDGELRESLRRTAGSAPMVKAHFAGFQNQSQLSPYYHASDLLVLASHYSEPWGLVVNEALHHGLPAVVSEAVGCAPDLVEAGRTGELFKTGSKAELAAAIQRGLALAGSRETRERCRQKVSGYSLERAAEGLARAYRAVEGGCGGE